MFRVEFDLRAPGSSCFFFIFFFFLGGGFGFRGLGFRVWGLGV